MPRRKVFLILAPERQWEIGRVKGLWGLPPGGENSIQTLKDAGFASGSEFLACSFQKAFFRAVVDGNAKGPYWDDEPEVFGWAPNRKHCYPVRFQFTHVEDVNEDWFSGQGDCRDALKEVYAKSVWVLKPTAHGSSGVRMDVVFGVAEGQGGPVPEQADQRNAEPFLNEARFGLVTITSPDELEDRVAELFGVIGFSVEPLGHNREGERVPDGLASLPKSMAERLKSLGLDKDRYFLLWDCKFSVKSTGLGADEERKLKEYATTYADSAKGRADAGKFRFLLVGKEEGDTERMSATADKLSNDGDVQGHGCLAVRAVSYRSLRQLAEEALQLQHDPDDVITQVFPDWIRKV